MRNGHYRIWDKAKNTENIETKKCTWKIKNAHCRTWNMARNTQKHGKLKMHTVGSGIWREKLKNEENKKCTL